MLCGNRIKICLLLLVAVSSCHGTQKPSRDNVRNQPGQQPLLGAIGDWFQQAKSHLPEAANQARQWTQDNVGDNIPEDFAQWAEAMKNSLGHEIANFDYDSMRNWMGTAVSDASQAVESIDISRVSDQVQTFFGKAVAEGHEKVIKVHLDALPRNIKQWIEQNPGQTAFYVSTGAVYFAPTLLSAPLLYMLGFTPLGPQGIAATIMSVLGTGNTGGLYPMLQSAGMAGYGAPIVAGAVQAGAAVAGAAQFISNLVNKAVEHGQNQDEGSEGAKATI